MGNKELIREVKRKETFVSIVRDTFKDFGGASYDGIYLEKNLPEDMTFRFAVKILSRLNEARIKLTEK